MTVSIIILAHNQWRYSKRCLESIYAVTEGVDFEVIFVDNASRSDEVNAVCEFAKTKGNMRVVCNSENVGYPKGVNMASKLANGKFLLLLNNDTYMDAKPWLGELIKCHEAHAPKCAIVGAKLLFPDGTIQHAGVVFNGSRYPYHHKQHSPSSDPSVNYERQFAAVTFACALIEKCVFDALGGLDESYSPGSFEDVDFCLRVVQGGFEIWYTPGCCLYHLEGGSTTFDAVKRTEWIQISQRNLILLLRKWGGVIKQDDQFVTAARTESAGGVKTVSLMGGIIPKQGST